MEKVMAKYFVLLTSFGSSLWFSQQTLNTHTHTHLHAHTQTLYCQRYQLLGVRWMNLSGPTQIGLEDNEVFLPLFDKFCETVCECELERKR